MQQVSVQTFKEIIAAESNNPSVDFINVCTPAEFSERHIEGVRNVPLDEIRNRTKEFQGKQTIYVHCRSGNRSAKAIALLEQLGIKAQLVNVSGGIVAWGNAGYPTNSFTTRMPIMRQVLLVAGMLVLTGIGLSMINPAYILLSAAIGAGLTFAGATGWCGMSIVLSRMPWNRAV